MPKTARDTKKESPSSKAGAKKVESKRAGAAKKAASTGKVATKAADVKSKLKPATVKPGAPAVKSKAPEHRASEAKGAAESKGKTGGKTAVPAKGAAAPPPPPPAKGGAAAPSKGAPAKVPVPIAEVAGAAGAGADKKKPPKGITIVTPRPVKAPKTKVKFQLPVTEPLLKPGAKWKPLITSGPSAPRQEHLGNLPDGTSLKTKLPKKELDRYRTILLKKRSELVGDISRIEDEALRQSGSGSLSALPQHMADQGTDVSDQSLSLDLAQVDRNLIREIDAALARIEAGTFGVCELTGKAIKPERLEELPWARYSIEAAREIERRPYRR
ncbi:MAG: TraR/DksA C4-type zinc finger protein [Phycisphaerales bacterium]|nr:TraR/DksA C4-type zinc finger protein [Phycisphaerales bacterium]